MIGYIKKSVTLAGTAWVTIQEFTGSGYLHEIYFKVPDNIGTGTNVLIGLFSACHLTDGDERYNSGDKAENDDYDLLLERCVTNGDKLMIKADGAATKAVAFKVYYEES
jgi:hypothetical protein